MKTYIIRKCVILLLIMQIVNVNASVDEEYCLHLQTNIKEKEIQNNLITWVDKEFHDSLLITNKNRTGFSRIKPGRYGYKVYSFNWDILGFDTEKSEIKLLGLDVSDFFKKVPAGTPISMDALEKLRKPAEVSAIDSIFFSEKSYHGIIVKMRTSDGFIEEKYKNYLTVISDRVGVLCGRPPRD